MADHSLQRVSKSRATAWRSLVIDKALFTRFGVRTQSD